MALSVKGADDVSAGAVIAPVADAKLALHMQAPGSRIASQKSSRDRASTDFDGVAEHASRGVSTQAQRDQAKTHLDAVKRNLTAMQSDGEVIAQQASEGARLYVCGRLWRPFSLSAQLPIADLAAYVRRRMGGSS